MKPRLSLPTASSTSATWTATIFALDLQTGQPRWQKKLDTGFIAAAAVRDKRLFVGDIDGRLHCLDAATGETIWTFEAEAEISSGANFYQGQRPVRLARRHRSTA